MVFNIFNVGLIGSVLLTIILLLISYSGIADQIRDEEGYFRRKLNVRTILGGSIFILFLFGLLYVGNLIYIRRFSTAPEFMELWLNSFGIFMFVHLYDLIILDYLVIVKWHPKFLNLPDTNYYRSIRPHIKGFLRGIPLGIIASLIVSILML